MPSGSQVVLMGNRIASSEEGWETAFRMVTYMGKGTAVAGSRYRAAQERGL